MTFAIHVAAVFQNHKGFFGEAALFVALPLNVCNADVKRGGVAVVAIQGADFELLGADDVVVFVFHVVFLVTSKDTTKRGMHKRFLLFFCWEDVLGKLPTQARLA